MLATLLTAADALPESEFPEGVKRVRPVLVLVDADLQPGSSRFAAEHDLAVLLIGSEEGSVRARAAGELEGELEAIGHHYVSSLDDGAWQRHGPKKGAAA